MNKETRKLINKNMWKSKKKVYPDQDKEKNRLLDIFLRRNIPKKEKKGLMGMEGEIFNEAHENRSK